MNFRFYFLSTLILILTLTVNAFFSTHVILTPKNLKKHKFSFSSKKSKNDYTLKIKGPFKEGVWLVETKKAIEDIDHLIFRNKVWYNTYTHEEILKFKKINIDKNSDLKLKISAEKIKKTYLYTDHIKPVQDGGFYYTFLLNNFVKSQKN